MATNEYQEKMDGISERFKILRIRLSGQHAKLLALPRELRDHIWQYVVDEPYLLHRRHHPTCEHAQPFESCETLPAFEVDNFYWKVGTLRYTVGPSYVPTCKKLCARRQAMGLLRVNKMISREAGKLFYQLNTFCFTDHNHMHDTIEDMSYATKRQIQSLALCEQYHRSATWPTYIDSYVRDLLLIALGRLPNLRHLDLPPKYILPRRRLEPPAIPNVKRLELSLLQPVEFQKGGESYRVYLSISREFYAQNQGWEKHKFKSFVNESYALQSFLGRAWSEVDSNPPTHCEQTSYSFVTTLEDGTQQTASILALPRDSPELRRKKRMKSLAATIAASKANPYVAVRRSSPADELDHQAVLDERREARELQAREEERIRRNAEKKRLRKGRREMETEKKASRKRAGRKS